MTEPVWPNVAGAAYRGLIDDALKREDVRKVSFEARGLSIITSSGTIVTLVFGLAALATQATKFKLDSTTKTALAVSLGCLIVAAVFGILCNMPIGYGEADEKDLKRLLEDRFWLGRIAVGQKRVADAEIDQIDIARKANTSKGKLLVAGLVFEVLGVVAVAVGVLLILT